MNKQRRTELSEIIRHLENINTQLEDVKDEEDEAKCNMEDYPQFEYKCMDMEIAIDNMQSAYDSIDEAITFITDAME